MINHLYLRRALVLPVLGMAGSMAHAQATTTAPADPKKAPATTTSSKPGAHAAAPVPKASVRSALPASDKIPPTAPTGGAAAVTPAGDAAAKKHIAGVKYENRTASTGDAGSKDAAKVPTLDAGSKDAAK